MGQLCAKDALDSGTCAHWYIEAEGNIETSVARPSSRGVTVDRKATLMVQELKQDEHHWNQQDKMEAVYDVDGYTILHSGHLVPAKEQRVERNVGVGIVLDPQLTVAWRSAGADWMVVSSRIVTARVKLATQQNNILDRQGSSSKPVCVTVVNVYAPTHRTPQERKDEFYADLQKLLTVYTKMMCC